MPYIEYLVDVLGFVEFLGAKVRFPDTIDRVMKYAKIGFSMKRKMLRNSFATFPEGLELLSTAGIDETRRPQNLSVDEWINVANASK